MDGNEKKAILSENRRDKHASSIPCEDMSCETLDMCD